ncbi:MAG: sporulation initiation factor Spo0A C-terminal domain-containing protein, partial [Clostridiales bacterium]|nr:sporulation initiation factor Spo0A C-terminal domain-containing protein [Clostridiales bacterium]
MSNSNVIDFTEVRSEAIAETDISGANISNVDVRVEYMVTEAIKQFRIPAHLRGYTYLREAIMYAVSAP